MISILVSVVVGGVIVGLVVGMVGRLLVRAENPRPAEHGVVAKDISTPQRVRFVEDLPRGRRHSEVA